MKRDTPSPRLEDILAQQRKRSFWTWVADNSDAIIYRCFFAVVFMAIGFALCLALYYSRFS